MSIQSKYQQASFRGVPFFIKSERESSGKKVVIHEYPNSNKRFVEEMGVLPSSFSMTAFVHGNNAAQNAQNLARALKQTGVGVLIHPIFGRFEVKSTTFERSSEETAMGEIAFDIQFEQSEVNVSLSPLLSTASAVTSAADTARSAGFNALKLAMVISKSRDALLTTQKIATTVMRVVRGDFKSLSDLDPSGLSAFDRVFGTSTRNIFQAALEAERFAATLQNFYEAARNMVGPAGQRPAWEKAITYEQTRKKLPKNTAIRLAQESNTDSINAHTRINGLINLYESIAYTTFQTDSQLEEAQTLLSNTFDALFSDSGDNLVAADTDLRNAVLDLRNVTNSVLNESANNVFKIRDITPGETSFPLLAYQYYGNLDQLDTLLDLNQSVNWAEIRVGDTLKVVE